MTLFSGSAEAGEALAKMLRLGKSVSWQDALESLTGTREMSVGPIKRFFQPLQVCLVFKIFECLLFHLISKCIE